MMNKIDRTMETYVEAGAYARLLSDVGGRAAVEISKVLPAKDTDKFVALLYKIEEIISRADTQLFRDHPEIGDAGKDVFFGNLSDEPRTALDAEVIAVAKQKAEELFGSEE